VTFYNQRARFTGERTMRVGDEEVRGKRVFVASGSRAVVPPIDGLDEVDYLDNESVLSLASPPRSVVIVGGGYVGTEYAHFLAAVGSEVTLLQRGARLLPREEEDVSLVLERRLRERMDVRTDVTVTGVRREGGGYVVSGEKQEKGASRSGEQGDPPGTGAERLEFRGERVFIAAGRRSNADLLDVEKAGIKLTERGYIAVNDRLETSADKVWSFGDAIGKAMFTHAAGQEAAIAWHNSVHPDDAVEMDFDIVPHAVFTHPQIAAVGLTEKEAMERGIDYLIGRASYTDVTKGEAMREDDGFAKAIVDPVSHRILGFHIIGPYAPILIQEPANAMALGLDARQVVSAMHIHPALPELVQEALNRVGRR
jgi:mycothione reductase